VVKALQKPMSLRLQGLPYSVWQGRKTRGEKMKETSIMLLKTNGEKMTEIDLSIMLMKTRNIEVDFHYIDDNKYTYLRSGIGDRGRVANTKA
jgi:hypothetical protein